LGAQSWRELDKHRLASARPIYAAQPVRFDCGIIFGARLVVRACGTDLKFRAVPPTMPTLRRNPAKRFLTQGECTMKHDGFVKTLTVTLAVWGLTSGSVALAEQNQGVGPASAPTHTIFAKPTDNLDASRHAHDAVRMPPQQTATPAPGSPDALVQREKPMKGKIVAVGAGRNAQPKDHSNIEIGNNMELGKHR